MRCGLIGRKLAHSFSPEIHAELDAYAYKLYELEPEAVENFVRRGPLDAFNVTIPYKETVLPMMDELSERARRIGSVNTVVRRTDGTLFGDNTDADGMLYMFRRAGFCMTGKKVLVLGSGGSSRTACAVLKDLGAYPVVISRKGENNYGNLRLHADAEYIINTTPVGMYPNCGVSPLDISGFPRLCGVADIIYNPARTKLLLDCEAVGIPCINGLTMLVDQGRRASEIFTGKSIPESATDAIVGKIARRTENIVLIGMPGCGKSTVGQIIAERLGRPFCDADAELSARTGRSVPEIIRTDGEDAFRRLETECAAELGKRSGTVIACGGGVVTREENYPLYHQNGIILWLDRPVEELPVDGRPISQSRSVKVLYAERMPMYRKWSDITVSAAKTAEETAKLVLEALKL
ncbi:MAG: shikimate kinase [Clostridia bacterium]|nr:shikimate kinase [Clostridia bacterium]